MSISNGRHLKGDLTYVQDDRLRLRDIGVAGARLRADEFAFFDETLPGVCEHGIALIEREEGDASDGDDSVHVHMVRRRVRSSGVKTLT